MKLIKWLIGIIIILIVVVIVALVIVTKVIDPNDYKSQIETLVENQTGRELTIEGDISWQFFPRLGLDLGAIGLANAAEFDQNDVFATIDSASVVIKTLPLLRGHVDVDRIVLNGLVLNLIRNANGATNWDDLVSPAAVPKATQETTPNTAPVAEANSQTSGTSGGNGGFALDIQGVDINNATITWTDLQEEQHVALTDFSLHSRGIQLNGRFFSVDTTFNLMATDPMVKLYADLTSQMAYDQNTNVAQIRQWDSRFELEGDAIANALNSFALSLSDLTLDLNAQSLNLNELTIEGNGFTVATSVQGSDILEDNRSFSGQVNVSPAVNVRALLEPYFPDELAMQDDDTLTAVTAYFQFNVANNRAILENLDVNLDDTHIQGQLAANQFEPLDATFDLTIDTLDLDRYMPAEPTSTSTASGASSGGTTDSSRAGAASSRSSANAPAPTWPAELRNIALSGQLVVDQLKAANLNLSQLNLQVAGQNGQFSLDPLSANLYQGQFQGDVALDVRTDTPSMAVNTQLSDVALTPLLNDLADFNRFDGQLTANINVTTRGSEQEAMLRNLNGNTQLNVNNGVLRDIDLACWWQSGQTLVQGNIDVNDLLTNIVPSFSNCMQGNDTEFLALSASANITNGVLHNNDLLFYNPVIYVTGAGSADLANDSLDYTLTVYQSEPSGDGNTYQPRGRGLPAPLIGSLSSPQLDSNALVESFAGSAVESAVGDVLNRFLGGSNNNQNADDTDGQQDEGNGDRLEDRIRGIFGF